MWSSGWSMQILSCSLQRCTFSKLSTFQVRQSALRKHIDDMLNRFMMTVHMSSLVRQRNEDNLEIFLRRLSY